MLAASSIFLFFVLIGFYVVIRIKVAIHSWVNFLLVIFFWFKMNPKSSKLKRRDCKQRLPLTFQMLHANV